MSNIESFFALAGHVHNKTTTPDGVEITVGVPGRRNEAVRFRGWGGELLRQRLHDVSAIVERCPAGQLSAEERALAERQVNILLCNLGWKGSATLDGTAFFKHAIRDDQDRLVWQWSIQATYREASAYDPAGKGIALLYRERGPTFGWDKVPPVLDTERHQWLLVYEGRPVALREVICEVPEGSWSRRVVIRDEVTPVTDVSDPEVWRVAHDHVPVSTPRGWVPASRRFADEFPQHAAALAEAYPRTHNLDDTASARIPLRAAQ